MRAFRVSYLALLVWLLSAAAISAASPIRQLTTTEAANLRPTWSPDHSKIAFQSNRDGAYHIYVMDADGSNTKQLSSGDNVDDRHPAWSPDGKFIAVDSGDTGRRDSGTQQLTKELASEAQSQCTFACHSARWSPDSTRLAFSDGDLTHVLLLSAVANTGTAPTVL